MLGACTAAYGYDNPVEGGATEFVSDTWTVPLPWLMVGSNSDSNTLFVWNGGRVESQVGIIGNAIGSEDNNAFVYGSNAMWNSSVEIAVGNLGGDNTLGVFDGGYVETPTLYVGKSSSSNFVAISGEGSTVNASALHIGHTGGGNGMGIMDGGRASSVNTSIGYWVQSDDNSVLIMGTNTVWNNTGSLNVGEHGSENMLMIVNGGRVQSSVINVGVKSYSSNNTISVWGENAVLTSSELNIGGTAVTPGGTGNRVSVRDGGRIETTDLTIHIGNDLDLNDGGTFAINNDFNASMDGFNFSPGGTLEVGGKLTGMGSRIEEQRSIVLSGSEALWNNGYYNLLVGEGGSTLVVSNGANLISGPVKIASGGSSFYVSGTDSVANLGGWDLKIEGDGSDLRLLNGGAISGGNGYVGDSLSSESSAMIHGTGSVWSNKYDLYVGYFGDNNVLEVSEGGLVCNRNSSIGLGPNAVGNTAHVLGGGSQWVNSGHLVLGKNGTRNSLSVEAGGHVESESGFIGYSYGADSNSVFITGTGSIWHNREALHLGGHMSGINWANGGTGNSLTVENGGWVLVGDVDTNHLPNIGTSGGLIVGDASGNPELIAANGSLIDAGYAYVGLGTNESGSMTLTGDSEMVVRDSLTIGHAGANNTLTVSDGATLNVGQTVASGGGWINNGYLVVGRSGSSNELSITDGGQVESSGGTIGSKAEANGNQVRVAGQNSTWKANLGGQTALVTTDLCQSGGTVIFDGPFFVGGAGSNNRLEILDGGAVFADDSVIGNGASAANNLVQVAGSNSFWQAGAHLHVGKQGGGNALVIESGGEVSCQSGNVGFASSDNSVLVTGTGSRWVVSSWFVGPSTNLPIILEPVSPLDPDLFGSLGAVNRDMGWGDGVLAVGRSGARNLLRIENGGAAYSRFGAVGFSAGNSNRVAIIGPNSLWHCSNGLFLGGRMENVFAGMVLATNSPAPIVSALQYPQCRKVPVWIDGGSDNSLTISNGGLVLVGNVDTDNFPDIGNSGGLVVGDASGNAELIAANQSVIDTGYAYIGLSSNESGSITLTGDSEMTVRNDLHVGYAGSGNKLNLMDGGQVDSFGGTIGYGVRADSNTVTVAGAGSLWDAKADSLIPWFPPYIRIEPHIYLPPGEWPVYQPKLFSVGHQGSGNFLSITAGGRVESSGSYIGYEETATDNSVLVSGAGSVWNSGTLSVGHNGAGNSLLVEDGGKVYSLNGTIGYGASADSNRVKISGAGSEWSIGFRPIIIDPEPPYTTFSALADNNSLAIDSEFYLIGRIDTFTVGQDGSNNRLEIENGAFVESPDGVIGRNSNAWNNAVVVTGNDSEWKNTHDLSLGGYMAEYVDVLVVGAGDVRAEWRDGGHGNSLYVGNGGLVSVGRDMHNRNYSGIAIDPGSHINIASNYYQDATSSLRFGVETNASGPVNALVSVGGTAEFETGAKLEYASNVGDLQFDRFYTNKLVEAGRLVVGGVTNANSLDLEKLAASGTLVDLLFWENDQDIYALVGRRYLADSAGFDTNSMMGRLTKEIDDLSLLGNATANGMINTLNGMSGEQQNAQLTQLYTQGTPTYMHTLAMHGGRRQVIARTRAFRVAEPVSPEALDEADTEEPEGAVPDTQQEEHGLRGWMQGYGSWADHQESGSFSGFDHSFYGTVAGMDKAYGNVLFGVAGGYARSYLNQDNSDSSDAWTRFGMLYATFAGEKWFGDVTLSYGRSRIKTRSGTVFGAEGKSDADNYAIYIGGGRDIRLSDGGLIFTPEAALSADYFKQEDYSDGYRDVDAYDRWSCQSRLGAALALQKQIGSVVLRPELHAYWLHEFNTETGHIGYSLTGGTGHYLFDMQAPDADILEAGVGIRAALTERLELMLGVDGQYSDRYEAVRASGRISFRF